MSGKGLVLAGKTTGYILSTVLIAILLGSTKKDPDHDHDKDKKACKHGDTNKKGKYRHNCDSDHDFFP